MSVCVCIFKNKAFLYRDFLILDKSLMNLFENVFCQNNKAAEL